MTISIGPYVEGEIPEPLEYQYLDSDGAAIDLTGYSATFQLQIGAGDSVELPASITDEEGGTVEHVWQNGELTRGVLRALFFVGNGTNRFASERFVAYISTPIHEETP